MLDAAAVAVAAERLRGVARRTPLRHSRALSEIAGAEVHLKLESEQLTGSFKIRGAFNHIASLGNAAKSRGVVTASAGNHGLGVAWAARHVGAPATIFIPASTPRVKRDGIAALGATIDATSAHYDAAHEAALRLAEQRGAHYVPACSGPAVLAGQGTVALEMLEALPAVASVVVPVGGGGLLGGMASLLRRDAPQVRIIGAQSDQTAAMARSLDAGRVVAVPVTPTLAEGLAGQIDAEALDYGLAGLDGMALVTEGEIANAIRWLVQEEGVAAEGSGAVGVAAILAGRVTLRSPAAVVITGGNIDPGRLDEIVAGIRSVN